MTVKYYSSLEEKKQLKKNAHARGESTIHDDFIDKNNNSTDGKSGRLTFEVKPDHIPTVDEIKIKELKEKAKSKTLTKEEQLEIIERLADML